MQRAIGLMLLALASACTDGETPATTAGDVVEACTVRQGWTASPSAPCLSCQNASQLAPCGCEAESDRAGACLTEADAVRAQADCLQGADACGRACDRRDCDCIAACYASAAACRALAGARDGCVARTCDSLCR